MTDPALTFTCPTCKRAVAAACWTVSGHVILKTPHRRRLDLGTGWVAGAASRQGEVDTLTTAGIVARAELVAYRAAHPDTPPVVVPPVVVTEPANPIPGAAIWVSPNGVDTNPGTEAKPRATAKAGAFNVMAGGTYPGYSQFVANGTVTTILVPEGATAILDGKAATKRALTCGGKVNLYGDGRVTNYAPVASSGTSCTALYYGGTAAGSEIDGWSVLGSAQAALGFEVPLLLTALTVTDSGYAGILGTTADGTRFGKVRVLRTNRGNHALDGQISPIKMTRSADLFFSPDVYIEDTGGTTGLWTDVSCRRPIVAGATVKTGAGKVAGIGLLIEETEGGTVAGCDIEGVYAMEVVASGHVRVLSNRLTGTSVGLLLTQDRAKNSGKTPANLDPALAPWFTTGCEVNGNTLVATGGYNIALTTLTRDAGLGLVTTRDMLAALRGNSFTGTVQLETAPGKRTTYAPAALGGVLGAAYSDVAPVLPADVTRLLA